MKKILFILFAILLCSCSNENDVQYKVKYKIYSNIPLVAKFADSDGTIKEVIINYDNVAIPIHNVYPNFKAFLSVKSANKNGLVKIEIQKSKVYNFGKTHYKVAVSSGEIYLNVNETAEIEYIIEEYD